jgi:hypothetical protein
VARTQRAQRRQRQQQIPERSREDEDDAFN